MNLELFSKLEAELVDLAGPLGKFVLKKQLKEMGKTPETFPIEDLPKLIRLVVPKAIFDEKLHREAIRTLTSKFKLA